MRIQTCYTCSMNTAMQRLGDGTIELTITVPWADVEKAYEQAVDGIVEKTELPGFRKGKAPRKMVEEKLDRGETYEEVLKRLIPQVYGQAVHEQKIHPIISPKIELKEATEKKDWVIRALTAEKPEVTLGEYKKAIAEVKTSKHKKIWVPGQEPKTEEKKEEEVKPTLEELLVALIKSVTITIPALLIEHEVNRFLSDLIDQTKKLGLTVEQYLSSTGKTAQTVRKEYEEQAQRTLTLEFALEKIADTEGILISDDDIDTVIKTAKTDEEKKSLEHERYYIASVLRRQKTLDFLASV